MKNIIFLLIFGLVGVMCVIFIPANSSACANEDYLRLHIRANSNSEDDQTVKYKVKAAVVDFLTDKVNKATSKNEVEDIINQNLNNIEKVADEELKKNGFSYVSSASVKNEFFPSRSYEDLVLKEGWYDALIINLGEGKGDNWWCVVYPPLCFVGASSNGGSTIKYKSIIEELFDNILQ